MKRSRSSGTQTSEVAPTRRSERVKPSPADEPSPSQVLKAAQSIQLTQDIQGTKNEIEVFQSCLLNSGLDDDDDDDDGTLAVGLTPRGGNMPRGVFLQRQLSCGMRMLDDNGWLSSSLMDLVLSKLARHYPRIRFMAVDFAVLSLSPKATTVDFHEIRCIRGNLLNYSDTSPIIFLFNANGIHWNLIRVVRKGRPELQLFEPMGKPSSRHVGLSLRDLPPGLIRWLDLCIPIRQGGSWIASSTSIITTRQQLNGDDCGVACLLYAEKAAQGRSATEIASSTSQEEITSYRSTLKTFSKKEAAKNVRHFDEPASQKRN